MISSCLGPAIILEYIHALSVERPEWKKKERVLETIIGNTWRNINFSIPSLIHFKLNTF